MARDFGRPPAEVQSRKAVLIGEAALEMPCKNAESHGHQPEPDADTCDCNAGLRVKFGFDHTDGREDRHGCQHRGNHGSGVCHTGGLVLGHGDDCGVQPDRARDGLALIVALKDLRDRGQWTATDDGKP